MAGLEGLSGPGAGVGAARATDAAAKQGKLFGEYAESLTGVLQEQLKGQIETAKAKAGKKISDDLGGLIG